jgi:hypothetical protein
VRVSYRSGAGQDVVSTLERVAVSDVVLGLPVREFRWVKGQRHYSGWYWSSTMGRHVVYESRLELARILLADFDPRVTGIAAQPFLLAGRDGDRQRRHVPDVLLEHADGGVTVVDVKPAERAAQDKVRAVFAWTREVVARRGWAFEVWTGADPVVLANVRFLAGYRRPIVVDESLVPQVIAAAAAGVGTVRTLERAAGQRVPVTLTRPVVLHLLWSGRLTADLSAPLGPDSPVSLVGQAPS